MIIKMSVNATRGGLTTNVELSWEEVQAFKKILANGLQSVDVQKEKITQKEEEAAQQFIRTINKIKVA